MKATTVLSCGSVTLSHCGLAISPRFSTLTLGWFLVAVLHVLDSAPASSFPRNIPRLAHVPGHRGASAAATVGPSRPPPLRLRSVSDACAP